MLHTLPAATVRRCRLAVATPVCSAAQDDDWREEAADAMEARDWASVEAAVAAAVRGEAPLPGDAPAPMAFEEQPVSRSPSQVRKSAARVTWRLRVAYLGVAFSGFAWQAAAPKPTVEGCLQQAIQPLLDGRSELRLSCAGRTDVLLLCHLC